MLTIQITVNPTKLYFCKIQVEISNFIRKNVNFDVKCNIFSLFRPFIISNFIFCFTISNIMLSMHTICLLSRPFKKSTLCWMCLSIGCNVSNKCIHCFALWNVSNAWSHKSIALNIFLKTILATRILKALLSLFLPGRGALSALPPPHHLVLFCHWSLENENKACKRRGVTNPFWQ